MKRTLATAAAMLMATVAATASATPAHADVLCMTVENAPFYASIDGYGGTGYLFTLSPGRGFRADGWGYNDAYGRNWIRGHGAEHPDRTGWTLHSHTSC
ncbi:hypothetical protein QEZ54_19950 [Catellatospora sp. KI3]|uniref:hypothetical protein n=1 Tax=Catellatospora sp. KI3 TaxID=3041620 RepID=UPI002482D37D|nr:hypothetical protein [Catellatospora sp. KI3]MDI1463259.1 hypothetical protein [Catellatospora sp. KI3]